MKKSQLEQLKQLARANNGLTLNANEKIVNLSNGFMVSVHQHEKIFASLNALDLETLNNYILTARKLNKSEKSFKAYVGIWVDTNDNGKTYLDISLLIPNKQLALSIAKKEQQKAIFDNGNQDCIYLDAVAQ